MSAYGNYPNPQCYDETNHLHRMCMKEQLFRPNRRRIKRRIMIVKLFDPRKNEIGDFEVDYIFSPKTYSNKQEFISMLNLTPRLRRRINRKPKTHFRK